jgi:hypothetical protein
MAFLTFFKINECGKLAVFAGSFEVLFDFFDPTTSPGPGTPPANSWRTKQYI